MPHLNQHSIFSNNQKFIATLQICVERPSRPNYGLWKKPDSGICSSLFICNNDIRMVLYEYSSIPYCHFHLFFVDKCDGFFPSFGWFLNRSVIFECTHHHTLTHTPPILLIVNAHSNEIIPAPLFSAINIKFLCCRVHLSHIILCRLSWCCILFVSGRPFLLCVASFQWIFISDFHDIAFHAEMKMFTNGFPLV